MIDFMVPDTSSPRKARDLLVRQARAVRGRATFELACHPAFDYGRAPHTVEVVAGVGAVFESPAGHCVLRTTVPLKVEESGVAATFTLDEGESADLQLESRGEVRPLAEGETADLFTLTSDFWQNWVSQSRYRGRWRETVQRSALALKLQPGPRARPPLSGPAGATSSPQRTVRPADQRPPGRRAAGRDIPPISG